MNSSSSKKENTDIAADEIETGRLGCALRQMGDRLSASLFDSLKQQPQTLLEAPRAYRSSKSFILAFGLAVLIHASTITLACWAIYTLLFSDSGYILKGIAIMVACICWTLRPRQAKTPKNILPRETFPTLYSISDKAAKLMNAPVLDGICVTPEFNASYQMIGWGRGRRYMNIGLPLFYAMSNTERVAVISHELAHGANGDPLRSRFLWSAIYTLRAWAILIRPVSIGDGGGSGSGLQAWFAIPFELIMLLLSNIALWISSGIGLLVLRQSQRAEYLADALAATVAGRNPMHMALKKTDLSEHIHLALIDMALLRSKASLRDIINKAVEQPPEVFQALAERSQTERWRVDTTHPPTAMRIALIANQTANPPKLRLSQIEVQGLESELEKLASEIHRELMNTYREISLPSH